MATPTPLLAHKRISQGNPAAANLICLREGGRLIFDLLPLCLSGFLLKQLTFSPTATFHFHL